MNTKPCHRYNDHLPFGLLLLPAAFVGNPHDDEDFAGEILKR